MKLYGSRNSPFVRHCRVALAQGGVDFEFIEVDVITSARISPTAKVPYFEAGDLKLTDSSSILKYVREQADQSFLAELDDFELFTMANTLLDSAINLFLLELNGITAEHAPYLARQQQRVQSGLAELNRRIEPAQALVKDSALRCACFIDWALFRERISLDGLDRLAELLNAANQHNLFAETAPPR